jgi:hypothetical protein
VKKYNKEKIDSWIVTFIVVYLLASITEFLFFSAIACINNADCIKFNLMPYVWTYLGVNCIILMLCVPTTCQLEDDDN